MARTKTPTKTKIKVAKDEWLSFNGTYLTEGHWLAPHTSVELTDKTFQSLIDAGTKFSTRYGKLVTGDDAFMPNIDTILFKHKAELAQPFTILPAILLVGAGSDPQQLGLVLQGGVIVGFKQEWMGMARHATTAQIDPKGPCFFVQPNGDIIAIMPHAYDNHLTELHALLHACVEAAV